ncbi:bifunctional folylpolyglutamate synthase/dihydrofolate synthase [Sphingomonas lycopersici]|uniref:Dihydrofolate synthase/folylpolyglutamate synthase n=1 Tax=Sphingomonas lycopersici TaxID=2951807 RepID=A0AA41Z5J0_9SPHN|nr:bifunctional folylpolyglutamate synthase/dihydrofolate synthase [Sphingomonas lycopersici]MCW6534427.1 bifunctional folylpolyglutamate synthase/dihydrofolate synthase [Sphingomonas lycopersici]
MADHAVSTDPAVQAQLDRLWSLSPGADVLGLGRITELLARVGDPQRRLPPVFHVAGTNGKGSTCAFLRAALEAAGLKVHAYTSPHLVRFNERIRVAGRLIDDRALAPLLAEVLDVAGDIGASFFEVTTAAAFLAFARTPADACVIEVGLGGRLDATNVIPHPAICGIAALGIDHEAFLLAEEAGTPAAPLDRIGFEKAGIAKPGIPLVTQLYPRSVATTIAAVATACGAPLIARGSGWDIAPAGDSLLYRDTRGELALPVPTLTGPYQAENAGLAAAMLRHQQAVTIDDAAIADGIRTATWPARMQRLGDGPLTRRLRPEQRRHGVWLDGAHNESAAAAIAGSWGDDAPTAIVIGMLANKDADGVIRHLLDRRGETHVVAVPVPSHAHHQPEALAAIARRHGAASTATAETIGDALDLIAAAGTGESVLIAGSLYIAGGVLAANGESPT